MMINEKMKCSTHIHLSVPAVRAHMCGCFPLRAFSELGSAN